MHITVVLSTARTERQSENVAEVVFDAFNRAEGVHATYVDVKDHVMTPTTRPSWGTEGLDTPLLKWKEIAEGTDGFVFVIPEYNHGYPGEWKLLVDALTKPFHGKAAAVVGVSRGIFSGARVIEHVAPVLIELGFVTRNTALYFGNVGERFDEAGNLIDHEQMKRMDKFVEAFISDVEETL